MWGQGYANKRATEFLKKKQLDGSLNNAIGLKKVSSNDDASKSSLSSRRSTDSTASTKSASKKSSNKMSTSTKHSTKAVSSQQFDFQDKKKNAQKALEHIQKTILLQEEREDNIQLKIKENMVTAKQKLNSGNQRAAVRYMKKVKMYQFELNKVASAIETLEIQTLSIESSLNHADVLVAMQEGKSAMQNIESSGSMLVEDVETILEEIRDTLDYSKEIDDILSNPIDDLVIDDDELLNELANYDIEPANIGNDNLRHTLPLVPESSIEKKVEEKKQSGFWVLS